MVRILIVSVVLACGCSDRTRDEPDAECDAGAFTDYQCTTSQWVEVGCYDGQWVDGNCPPYCAPGDANPCPCFSGTYGMQTCDDNGTSWGDCACAL